MNKKKMQADLERVAAKVKGPVLVDQQLWSYLGGNRSVTYLDYLEIACKVILTDGKPKEAGFNCKGDCPFESGMVSMRVSQILGRLLIYLIMNRIFTEEDKRHLWRSLQK